MGGIIVGFVPWIVFFSLPNQTQQQINFAVIFVLGLTLLLNRKGLKAGFILPWGTVVFFVFALIMVVVLKNDWVAKPVNLNLLVNAMLALIAWLSMAIGKPFTIQYARQKVSQEFWDSPRFLFVNKMITLVWALAFTINMIISLMIIYNPALQHWITEFVTDGTTIAGLAFTFWFPDWYRERKKS